MMGRFHLYTYENASGRDEIVNGVLEPGADPTLFFGLPYPFLQNGGTPEAPAQSYPSNPKDVPTPAQINAMNSPNATNTGNTVNSVNAPNNDA